MNQPPTDAELKQEDRDRKSREEQQTDESEDAPEEEEATENETGDETPALPNPPNADLFQIGHAGGNRYVVWDAEDAGLYHVDLNKNAKILCTCDDDLCAHVPLVVARMPERVEYEDELAWFVSHSAQTVMDLQDRLRNELDVLARSREANVVGAHEKARPNDVDQTMDWDEDRLVSEFETWMADNFAKPELVEIGWYDRSRAEPSGPTGPGIKFKLQFIEDDEEREKRQKQFKAVVTNVDEIHYQGKDRDKKDHSWYNFVRANDVDTVTST